MTQGNESLLGGPQDVATTSFPNSCLLATDLFNLQHRVSLPFYQTIFLFGFNEVPASLSAVQILPPLASH